MLFTRNINPTNLFLIGSKYESFYHVSFFMQKKEALELICFLTFTQFMCREEVPTGAHQGVIEKLYGLRKFVHSKKCSFVFSVFM